MDDARGTRAQMRAVAAELAAAIDLRVAALWADLFETLPPDTNLDRFGWILRAAYTQGFFDAVRDPASTDLLRRELGITPDTGCERRG